MTPNRFVVLLIITCLLQACDEDDRQAAFVGTVKDFMPIIIIEGSSVDTAFLLTNYKDRGAYIHDGVDNCPSLCADVSGFVDTHVPGTYLIKYNGKAEDGRIAAMVTRTVHVVENKAGFLSGNYNVVCTCTSSVKGVQDQLVSTVNYSSTVNPGMHNKQFELIPYFVGPQYIIPETWLNGAAIEGQYFSPDVTNTVLTGTVSPSRNSFTIMSTSYSYYPTKTFKCTNVFTKQVIEITNKN